MVIAHGTACTTKLIGTARLLLAPCRKIEARQGGRWWTDLAPCPASRDPFLSYWPAAFPCNRLPWAVSQLSIPGKCASYVATESHGISHHSALLRCPTAGSGWLRARGGPLAPCRRPPRRLPLSLAPKSITGSEQARDSNADNSTTSLPARTAVLSASSVPSLHLSGFHLSAQPLTARLPIHPARHHEPNMSARHTPDGPPAPGLAAIHPNK